MQFKKGRGKLGRFGPLLGTWRHQGESPQGSLSCEREFTKTLGGKYIQLKATWETPSFHYEEICLFGALDKNVGFWSFTSEGKRSNGHLAPAQDIHKDAIAFEAQMPSGYARQVYWPHEDEDAFYWVVESKNKKGWNRFTEHLYRPPKDHH